MESPIDFVNPQNSERQWKDNSNDKLKDRGSSNRVININYIYIAFALILIAWVLVFYYLGTNDYFKSDVNNQQICANLTCPNFPSIPSCPTCTNNCNVTVLGFNNSYIYNNTFILNNTNSSI